MVSKSLAEQIAELHKYSACDISDALLKLQKVPNGIAPHAGYISDVVPYAPHSPFMLPSTSQPKIIAPASTVTLIDKFSPRRPLAADDPHGIPAGSHWVDQTVEHTVVVIEQPSEHKCAAIGGIMAYRMKARGAVGCVVGGRVRDLAELKDSGLPVWAVARSTVGSGAETKFHARNIPVTIQGVEVAAGDIIFADPLEGVVSIPRKLLDDVVTLLPQLVLADDNVKTDVIAGKGAMESFKQHRHQQ